MNYEIDAFFGAHTEADHDVRPRGSM